MAHSISSSSVFLSTALSTSNPYSLSYIHFSLKWLIHNHLLCLLQDFPTLSLSVDSFTGHDGATANFLKTHGSLPSSPAALLTIWLTERYPFSPPLVFVFPSGRHLELCCGHPFISSSTGAAATPYLEDWQYPSSNLSDLVQDLVSLFNICPPFYTCKESTPVQVQRAGMADQLATSMRRDMTIFLAQAEDDISNLLRLQADLKDRACVIEELVMPGLESEREDLERALIEKMELIEELGVWMRVHGTGCMLQAHQDEVEGFEAVGESSRSLLKSTAADLAADDVMDALGKALEEGVVSFNEYIKKARGLVREQFFHRAMVVKMHKRKF